MTLSNLTVRTWLTRCNKVWMQKKSPENRQKQWNDAHGTLTPPARAKNFKKVVIWGTVGFVLKRRIECRFMVICVPNISGKKCVYQSTFIFIKSEKKVVKSWSNLTNQLSSSKKVKKKVRYMFWMENYDD